MVSNGLDDVAPAKMLRKESVDTSSVDIADAGPITFAHTYDIETFAIEDEPVGTATDETNDSTGDTVPDIGVAALAGFLVADAVDRRRC